jgi:lipopolysaccharide biosynthesis glycosyltransferase
MNKKIIDCIKLIIGYDERESVAFHTCVESILNKSTQPISYMPLNLGNLNGYIERHRDGSNSFIYSRFLTPLLMGYEGWAIYIDGDMIINSDISNLWKLRNNKYALMVVKHDYKTKVKNKYLGNINQDYPRKNWSSVILWNCGHPKNKALTAEVIENSTGSYLHRFSWLEDHEIGELDIGWNWLVGEYEENLRANLLHYTLGTPCFKEYNTGPSANLWYLEWKKSQKGFD